jgi:glycogen debranching enzyme
LVPNPTLIEDAVVRSLSLLRGNSTSAGLAAAVPTGHARARGYARIFARDAGLSALGMALSGEEDLIAAARASLRTLGRLQAENGQIPTCVDPESGEADFWYVGCIDASLWWLVARDFLSHHAPDAAFDHESDARVATVLEWLRCQEHPRLGLLQQNEASDWADIMPRSGFVLYTNALWYHVKRLYGLEGARETKKNFNDLFYPFSREIPEYKRLRLLRHYARSAAADDSLYLSFVNLSFCGGEGDAFGNLLAVLLGLADEASCGRILDALRKSGVHRPYPMRAVVRPIERSDKMWRPYMSRHRQNLEHQYHNGGIWPMIGAFWVMSLAHLGRFDEAGEELEHVARANALGDWEFNEWLHGRTGMPSGMKGQSWNASSFLLAHHSLTKRLFPGPILGRLQTG